MNSKNVQSVKSRPPRARAEDAADRRTHQMYLLVWDPSIELFRVYSFFKCVETIFWSIHSPTDILFLPEAGNALATSLELHGHSEIIEFHQHNPADASCGPLGLIIAHSSIYSVRVRSDNGAFIKRGRFLIKTGILRVALVDSYFTAGSRAPASFRTLAARPPPAPAAARRCSMARTLVDYRFMKLSGYAELSKPNKLYVTLSLSDAFLQRRDL
ncbi:hypothetical protein EVAR_56024_1 [Eumeta japonica]|uniref:Uncharacterized protein n=1 Tax=Eumeta variegata TaxID=151549 RepID=A0A4C1YMM2_EUMVA|nr:hypothetical protein EVAR_56024_1 [Eumeta japonica]